MKKRIILFILSNLLIFPGLLLAESIKIEGCLNYYSISDSIYKDIYGSGNIMFGGSVSYEVINKLELRAEINYYQDKGEMTLTKEEITFTIIPIVFGMRYQLIKNKNFNPYFGGGLSYYTYKEDLPPRFEDVSDSTLGYHIEGGGYFNLVKGVYINLNIRYIIADAKSEEETIKLGGFRAGMGIGYNF
jgi:outer membrane protein W